LEGGKKMKYRRFGKVKPCYHEFDGCNKDHPLGAKCNARMTGRYFEVDPHQPPVEPCVKHLSYFLSHFEEIKKHTFWCKPDGVEWRVPVVGKLYPGMVVTNVEQYMMRDQN
jgi:hypothetical protein